MSKYQEYLICKVRGHETDPYASTTSYAIANSPVFKTCKWCGSTFWTTTTTEEHEKNVPEAPKG